MKELFKFDFKQISNDKILLEIGFGEPATNQEIVEFVAKKAPELNGELLLVNGRASLPVAFVLSHKYAHLFSAIAVFDPKLNGYVVAVSHHPKYKIGELINE